MYMAKKRGENNNYFYTPGLEKENLKVGKENLRPNVIRYLLNQKVTSNPCHLLI